MPDTPDRAAREAAAEALLKRCAPSDDAISVALNVLRLEAQRCRTMAARPWRVIPEADLRCATQLEAVAAWLEEQDGVR